MGFRYELKREVMLENRGKLKKGTPQKHLHWPGPRVTKENLSRAIRGSLGIKNRIARRLHVTPLTVSHCLNRAGWEPLLEEYRTECERVVDDAETTVGFMVKQRDDYGTALSASKFVLGSKGSVRGYSEKRELALSGGSSPIRVQTNVVDLEALGLPLEVRRDILQKIHDAQIHTGIHTEEQRGEPQGEEGKVMVKVRRVRG